jgi:hypothetical protein
MAYNDFDLRTAVRNFELMQDDPDLFAPVKTMEPSHFLRIWLDEFAPSALMMSSDKARSAYIITPILAEVQRRSDFTVKVLPGVKFDVDLPQGLTGRCDYLVVRSKSVLLVESPVLAVVEAEKEDITAGLGRCAAQMVAIQSFNQQEGTSLPAAYGCVTSGSVWKFLKLSDKVLSIDHRYYYLSEAPKLLGILVSIVRGECERTN